LIHTAFLSILSQIAFLSVEGAATFPVSQAPQFSARWQSLLQ
jgi:hypothetical protein